MMKRFGLLYNLMAAYLNQDYYLICGSEAIEDAVTYYVLEVDAADLIDLLREINHFESEFSTDLERAFEEEFSPDIDVGGVSNFLNLLRTTIKKHYPTID